jgi:hypothetical protein
VAGELEFETAKDRTAKGIPLLVSVVNDLRDVGKQLGITYDLE